MAADLRERLDAHVLLCPGDPPGTLIPTGAQLVTRAWVLGRELRGLRPALAQITLTPEQRVLVANGLDRLSDAVTQVCAAAGLLRTGKP
jgi:hypothetical protein